MPGARIRSGNLPCLAPAPGRGLPAFEPGGGLLSNLVGLVWSWDLAAHWLLVGHLEAIRMQGDAARSPLTERRLNESIVVGVAYRF